MQGKAHPTQARIAHSSLRAGIGDLFVKVVSLRASIGDLFVKVVPAVPDKFVVPGVLALWTLYGIALFLYLLPFSFGLPYFGVLMLVGFAILVRNALAESRAEKARQHERDHANEHDER